MDRPSRTSWLFLLDWGVVVLTLVSAGASALAALIAFNHDDASTMGEAGLACASAIGAAWLGRSASKAARRWQEELVSWHGNDIVLLLDARGRIVDANDRAVEAYGWPVDALFQHGLAELRHGTAPSGGGAIEGILAAGRALFESVHRRADGSPFPVEVSARVLTIQGRAFIHLIVRDVTEPHRARTQLVAAERLAAVGAVTAAMAHDINNPLCGVLGNVNFGLEALEEPRPDLAELRRALADAREAALRVRDLVRDVNAFANGFAEREESADLRLAILDAIDVEQELLGRRCRVRVDVPPEAWIRAPIRRVSQVFRSILRGAALAMPETIAPAHEIRIAARGAEALRVVVEVQDDGPPLAPPSTPVPLDAAAPSAPRGAGAGLAAVMGMVRAVGGDVSGEHVTGRGNVIRVVLPAVPRAPTRDAPSASASLPSPVIAAPDGPPRATKPVS